MSFSMEPREGSLHFAMGKLGTKNDECLCESLYSLRLAS